MHDRLGLPGALGSGAQLALPAPLGRGVDDAVDQHAAGADAVGLHADDHLVAVLGALGRDHLA
jgi:hypothetical protein